MPSTPSRPRTRRSILDGLGRGDRRSVQGVPAAVRATLADPRHFGALFDGMSHDDALVRMRAADAVEKITSARPELLRPYGRRLVALAGRARQPEVKWHVAQLLSRVPLGPRARQKAARILFGYLEDDSRIVKTFAMQALADLAMVDRTLKPTVVHTLLRLTTTGSPAMQSRGRKLLARLGATVP